MELELKAAAHLNPGLLNYVSKHVDFSGVLRLKSLRPRSPKCSLHVARRGAARLSAAPRQEDFAPFREEGRGASSTARWSCLGVFVLEDGQASGFQINGSRSLWCEDFRKDSGLNILRVNRPKASGGVWCV